MNKFKALITHNGPSKEIFLSSLQDRIDKPLKFGKRFSLTNELHSAIEEAISDIDNGEGSSRDTLVVSLFNGKKLMNKFLYHTFPGIGEWIHVEVTSLDL
jgi:hypothetical protein